MPTSLAATSAALNAKYGLGKPLTVFNGREHVTPKPTKSFDPYAALLGATPQQIAAEKFRLTAAGPDYSGIAQPDFDQLQTAALSQAQSRADRLGAPYKDEREFQKARQQVSNQAAANFAAAFGQILGGGNPNPDDPAAQKYSLENFGGSFLGGMAARMGQQLMMQAGDTFAEEDHRLASKLADIMEAVPDEAEKIYEGLVSQAQDLVKEQKTFADAEYKTQIAALAALEVSKRKDSGGSDGVPKVKNFSDGTTRQYNPKTGKWDVLSSKTASGHDISYVTQPGGGVVGFDKTNGKIVYTIKGTGTTGGSSGSSGGSSKAASTRVYGNSETGYYEKKGGKMVKIPGYVPPGSDGSSGSGTKGESASTTSNTVKRATTEAESVLTKMYDRIWKRMPGKNDDEANAAFDKYLTESGSKVFGTAMYQVIKAISPHLKPLGWTAAQVKAEAFRLVTSVGDEDGNVIKPPKGYKVPTAKPVAYKRQEPSGSSGHLATAGGGGFNGVDTDGFIDEFDSRLTAMIAASGGRLSITSGYRNADYQAKLFAEAVKKYGSEAAARKWVAPPGRSNHGRGIAADISGDLAWAHANAARFGLNFPMSWENWHIELAADGRA